jgi:putative metallohydrolase (TIGR04338 family)
MDLDKYFPGSRTTRLSFPDPEKDRQAELVYGVESELLTTDLVRSFKHLNEIKEWMLKIMRTRSFRRRHDDVWFFKLHDGRGSAWAAGWRDRGTVHLKLPRNYRSDLIVMHELAHGLADGVHDAVFCRKYLWLVREFIGRPAWLALRDGFDKFGVKYRC